MDVSYASEDLQDLCESERSAKRKLGADSAKKLLARVADLKAASSVLKLPAGKPHPLKGNRLGQYAISLAGGFRLVFEANQKPVPRKADNSIDWIAVSSVKIVEVNDYHD